MFRKIQKLFSYKIENEELKEKNKILEEEVAYLNNVILTRDKVTNDANKVITQQFKLIKDLCFGNKCDTKEFDRLSKIENIADNNIFGLEGLKKLQEDKRTILYPEKVQ